MNNVPKVSIITPVYKAEKYIHRCLESIRNQSFSDWECILVDDGTPDKSGVICDEYAEIDPRFRVIHKQNGGVASARQAGVDAAIGIYSIHVDPDDYIDSMMLENMYREIVRQNVDILVCDYTIVYKNGKKNRIVQKPTGSDSKSLAEDILFQRLHGSLWNKIIKQSCYKDNNIGFYPNINNCEDVLIWVQLSCIKLSVGYFPSSYYNYCLNEDSITSNKSYNIDNYKALKSYINILDDFIYISEESKLVAAHAVKLKALENGCMSYNEYYSFKCPDIKTVLLPKPKRDKIFGILAYFRFYYLGLIVYRIIQKSIKFMSLSKRLVLSKLKK